MLKFNEFLKEAADPVIEVDDARRLLNNKDDINTNLDALTAKPYQNAPIFLTQLRGVLERYGINLPQSVTPNFLNLSAELVFALSSASSSMPAQAWTSAPPPSSPWPGRSRRRSAMSVSAGSTGCRSRSSRPRPIRSARRATAMAWCRRRWPWPMRARCRRGRWCSATRRRRAR